MIERRITESELQGWSREHFGLTYGELCTLVALVTGYRLWGIAMLASEVDEVVRAAEYRHSNHYVALQFRGLVEKGIKVGPNANKQTWRPTEKALRLLPPVLTLAKAEARADAERKAG